MAGTCKANGRQSSKTKANNKNGKTLEKTRTTRKHKVNKIKRHLKRYGATGNDKVALAALDRQEKS